MGERTRFLLVMARAMVTAPRAWTLVASAACLAVFVRAMVIALPLYAWVFLVVAAKLALVSLFWDDVADWARDLWFYVGTGMTERERQQREWDKHVGK